MILFEGMILQAERILTIRRRGHAIFYRSVNGGRPEFLFGYRDLYDAHWARRYLARKLHEAG